MNELFGLELELWIGLFAPRGLSPEIVSRLERVSTNIINAADFKAKLADQALVVRSVTGDEFRSYLEKEKAKYKEIVEIGKITVQ